MDGQGMPDAVYEFWDAFIDDVAATAAEYRENGWDVLELHPGDVTPQPDQFDRRPSEPDEPDEADAADGGRGAADGTDTGFESPSDTDVESPTDTDIESPTDAPDRLGFDVLVPDDEFEALEARLADGFAVSSYETYRAEAGAAAFVLVVERDDEREEAVFVPLHYRPADADRMESLARDRGEIRTDVRPLSRRRVATFSHDDPSSFFDAPETTATREGGDGGDATGN